MAVSRKKKESIYGELKDSIATQKAVLVLTTKDTAASLNSEYNSNFRKEARKSGVVIQVVKNTLINKAFSSVPSLEGQTYLAYLEDHIPSDEIAVPKAVVGLVGKDFKDNFLIFGSIVNGEFYNTTKTELLASTPSLEESLAMIAGSLNQVATKLALVIKEIPSSVARGVSEVQKIKS
jgi:large subunit ribosomal protein L10